MGKLKIGRLFSDEVEWFKTVIDISYDAAMTCEGSIQDLFLMQAKRLELELKEFVKLNKKKSTVKKKPVKRKKSE